MDIQQDSLVCSQLLDAIEYHAILCLNFYWRRRRHPDHRICCRLLVQILRDLRKFQQPPQTERLISWLQRAKSWPSRGLSSLAF